MNHQMIPSALTAGALAVATGLSGCGSSTGESSPASSSVSAEASTVTVFAAASLNGAGAELEKAFERSHEGVDITFNYAGSSKLVQQIDQGAAADILVTADQRTMDSAREKVAELKNAEPTVIASNTLVLATADGNPADITSVKGVAKDSVTTAICAEEVPCGALAHKELDREKLTLGNATEEKNVSDVSTKVASGAVDAGFIYSTDAETLKSQQDITVIELPGLEHNRYPMALTEQGEKSEAAKEFAQWLSGSEAQDILKKFHFMPAQS